MIRVTTTDGEVIEFETMADAMRFLLERMEQEPDADELSFGDDAEVDRRTI